MKSILKKIPAFAIVSLIIVLTVVVAVFTASSIKGDINGKDGLTNEEVVAMCKILLESRALKKVELV